MSADNENSGAAKKRTPQAKVIAQMMRRPAQANAPASSDPAIASPSGGNGAAARSLAGTKKVAPLADSYELEADKVADTVMSGGRGAPISRLSMPGSLQASARDGGLEHEPSNVERAIGAGGGAPLPGPTREKMERGFGRDLAQIRVHDGSSADAAADSVDAHAFTTGNDIYFAGGAYAPGTEHGDHLLAHEITHAIQQDGNRVGVQRRPINPVKREPLLDPNENDPALVDFERQLALVIRDNQDSFQGAVSKVTEFWRDFIIEYTLRHGEAEEERKRFLEKLHRPELATPEFLGQSRTGFSDEEALRKWRELVQSTPRGSVDLEMFFLRIVYDTLIDPKDAKQSLPRSRKILDEEVEQSLGQSRTPGKIDPERARKLPAVAYYFENRGRKPEKTKATEAIIGNVAVDPARSGKTQTILPAGDVAYDARVERGADSQLFDRFNPFYAEARILGLPLAAGISGSTADFIEMARLAGLNHAELQSFAMAIIYYLTLPGHHSFHEVATVLAAAGIVSYRPDPGVGDYDGPLTKRIRASTGYKRLSANYPGLLRPR